MPKKALAQLTESMFYLLLALSKQPMCGIEAADYIERLTKGRVQIGPATLYTVLARFEKEKYITEIEVDGRRRTYAITEKGTEAVCAEMQRLRQCLDDAAAAAREGATHGIDEVCLPAAALPGV